ncbi:hypothetical protein [Haloimpatiens massiliensis]|uniref:hypothetical protein n=1 Tax=Haloimpatiens massiliensis TaxID=1658110 RepID=UPI000C8563E1|nr:hypothetical protein [Haloimpatiens massiliensis]
MDLSTKDVLKKKILDAQENVRDYQMHSYNVQDKDVASLFKEFAEESAMQAKRMQEVLTKF